MTQPATRQQVRARPDTRVTTSGQPSPNGSPNGQVPLRGKTASDEEVRRVSRDITKRNRPLLNMLAK